MQIAYLAMMDDMPGDTPGARRDELDRRLGMVGEHAGRLPAAQHPAVTGPAAQARQDALLGRYGVEATG